ncbi:MULTISPECIES: hypothetical protein [Mycobacteroides]|uniref:hypothetical protein n=1 Tax=Mycobacteroides TaxID=670516 RepID=UPI0005DF8510|nr:MULTISPECIES: hypothetical protein [Mycobacteroides]CPR84656.1 Uncharacterised protein [Mycobacteroides abscessus]CPS03173.1 Uncharacterised protein [Mycobacteroides abscessus]CPT04452.1 Uncharacterised protein [Mycobacteroides abscessus]CPU33604.1 Uncharacterised protein [Mycobacteroides abscessus]CPV12174.1 Uncharacterised protein [Mycobacteroides abscessus]
MTTPSGPGGFNLPDRYGVTGTDGSVGNLVARTQPAIVGLLKERAKQSPGWTPLNQQFVEALVHWLGDLFNLPDPVEQDLIDFFTGKWDLLEAIRKALQGIDLTNPGAVLNAILEAAGKALGFSGVLSISRIANIIQDLINGAGEFLTAESVEGNPFFQWDSVMPGFISGGSIRATANGTQQVMRSEPFEVFPGQTLELRAASQWTGASATAGSNPVKVGFTPFDAAGNPLADVIRGTLQPSGDHGWQWVPVADKWPVPSGVKYVSQLLILDSGATAGTFWFSNASAWASNLLDLGLVKDLREMVDAIGGSVNSEVATIEARLQAITADGKITASEIVGLIQQAQVSGLAIMQTVINQILDILNGNIVTPINSLVQGVKDWFGLNQNKTQALNTSGQLDAGNLVGEIAKESVEGLADLGSNVTEGFKNIFDKWFGGTSAAGTPAEVAQTIEAIQQAVIGGWTVDVFTTNGTWSKPANLIECWMIAINGGGKGMPGGTSQTNADIVPGGLGGSSGGYIGQQVDPATIPASVPITVGPGASANGADGGTTSIGSLVSGSPNGSGISTIAGFTPTTSTPGRGGNGGQATGSGGSRGQDGGATPLGTAGIGGNGINSTGTAQAGTAGGNASLSAPTKAGGGGGGGGGGAGSTSSSGTRQGGNGGAGGYPGGGSGGGGSAVGGGTFATQTPGQSGPAPNGAAIIIYKAGG